MAKFTVLEEIEIEGTQRAVGEEIELSEEAAAPFVEAGHIQAIVPSGEEDLEESKEPLAEETPTELE